MTFLATSYVWVLPVALLPIVIYLLFRRRKRDVAWGAIYILRRVLESRRRFRAWLQYLILALRVLALAALVAVFARPTGPRPKVAEGRFPEPPLSTHRVILLDSSASMAARHAAGTRLEAALNLCRRFLTGGRAPAQLDLLPLDGRDTVLSCTDLPVSPSRREELLAACGAPAGTADLARGLRTATRLFRASPFEHRELYILSDFAARDWRAPQELTGLLAELRSTGVRIRCLSYSNARVSSFALLDLTAHSDLLLARQPALFYARIGYYGTLPSAETVLTVEADAGTSAVRVLLEESLNLAPGEKTLAFPLELPAGRHTLTASVRGDDLASDNTLTRTVEVRPVLNVAVVQDITDAKGFDNPRTWLSLALEKTGTSAAPTAPGVAGPRVNSTAEAVANANAASQNRDLDAVDQAGKAFEIILQGKIPEQLNTELLTTLDLVIVCGVSRMPPEAIEGLLGYVRQGGALLLAPEPDTPREDFNATYAALAPAALDAPRYHDQDPERYESCVTENPDLPLLRELESPEHGHLTNPRFYNWFTLRLEALSDRRGEVLLSLSDGAPLLLERRIGRGSVLLWTAGLGQAWHSMVVHPAYPVFLTRFATLAAARRSFPRNLNAGMPVVMPTTAAQVRVVRPDGESEVVATAALGERRFVRYEKTDLIGVYDVREDLASTTSGALFTVADAMPESDLRPLSGELEAGVERATGAALLHSESDLVREAASAYPGRSWMLPTALLMVLALLLEAALSRWCFT